MQIQCVPNWINHYIFFPFLKSVFLLTFSHLSQFHIFFHLKSSRHLRYIQVLHFSNIATHIFFHLKYCSVHSLFYIFYFLKCNVFPEFLIYKHIKSFTYDSLWYSLVQLSNLIYPNTSIIFIWQYLTTNLSWAHTLSGLCIFPLFRICSDFVFSHQIYSSLQSFP